MPVEPEHFPEYPLNPVAAHGATNHPVHTNAQPTVGQAVGPGYHGKSRPFLAPALPVYLHKLP